MMIRGTAAALVSAAVMLSASAPARGLLAHSAAASAQPGIPIVADVVQARVPLTATQQQADSATRDTAGARNPATLSQRNGNAPPPAENASGLRKVGMLVILIVLGGAAVVAFRIFAGYRSGGDDHDIPIIFQPRAHVPSIPEFPAARGRAPAPPYKPPSQAEGNNKRPVSEPAVVSNPMQGTLQLLPGRFEVAAGMDNQKEIRFVRVPGKPEVTFGRYAGEPHTHIQVDSPTVSRKHASMRFHLNRWHITNLSTTNPVVVNGQQLPANEERLLSDGDQVEMGEVIFRFRAR